jgi:uncharacterized protein (TIGR02145 family)
MKIIFLFVAISFASLGKAFSQVVRINNVIWCTENLDVSTFSNGEIIPHAKTAKEWIDACEKNQPAWCYYMEKEDKKYGKLYNYYAVMDPRGLAPKGFHVATNWEWSNLQSNKTYLLKSKKYWPDCTKCTNELGFDAVPGGWRGFQGSPAHKGDIGYWWSQGGIVYQIGASDKIEGRYGMERINFPNGCSVRCVRDK